ncbi:hypothetical protein ACFL55_02635 [Candidatus Latescibacterota bacterium]
MADTVLKKWGIVIILSHDEACDVSGGFVNLVNLIGTTMCLMFQHWCFWLGVVVFYHLWDIEYENAYSGGKGVRIKTWWGGQIWDVEARGSGDSPPCKNPQLGGSPSISQGLYISNRRFSENMNGERFLGNTKTMEVHDLDNEDDAENGCQIDEIIFAGHDTPFERWHEAHAAGYDNCAKCLLGSTR